MRKRSEEGGKRKMRKKEVKKEEKKRGEKRRKERGEKGRKERGEKRRKEREEKKQEKKRRQKDLNKSMIMMKMLSNYLKYNELYKKDLVEDLDSELSGDLKETVLGLMMPLVEFDAYILNKAMKGLGTDESVLTTVICSKSSAEIEEIVKVFKKEVKKETSGDYKDILLHILGGKRDKGDEVDLVKAEADAKAIHDYVSHRSLVRVGPPKERVTSSSGMTSLNGVDDLKEEEEVHFIV
ncbi:Annexin A13 [Bulinus truncatus]|nr:Annexin A13 [Bulinus truncatus]